MAAVEPFSPIPAPARAPGRRTSPTRSSSRRGSATSISYSSPFASGGRITRATAKHPLSGIAADQLSPLRRSTGVLHLDQASFGSPVPKRSFLSQFSELPSDDRLDQPPPSPLSQAHAPQFSNSAFSAPIATPTSQPKPPTFAKSRLSGFGFGKKEPAGSSATNQLFKVRRTHSVENLLARDSPFSNNAPLPSASIHPHPLSQSLTPSNLNSEDDDIDVKPAARKFNSLGFAAKKKRPSLPGSSSWSTLSNAVASSSSSSTETPPNYRLVKPFQPAFMSTGLLSKRNRQNLGSIDSLHFAPPETPCKRPAQPQFTVVAPSSSLKALDNTRMFDADEVFDTGNSGFDYEMPPTPTKAFAAQHASPQVQVLATPPQGWPIPNNLSMYY